MEIIPFILSHLGTCIFEKVSSMDIVKEKFIVRNERKKEIDEKYVGEGIDKNKRLKGQNKKRNNKRKSTENNLLCWKFAKIGECDCVTDSDNYANFHNVERRLKYLIENKNESSKYETFCPYKAKGKSCPFGLNCHYAYQHCNDEINSDFFGRKCSLKELDEIKIDNNPLNYITMDMKKKLRRHQYSMERSNRASSILDKLKFEKNPQDLKEKKELSEEIKTNQFYRTDHGNETEFLYDDKITKNFIDFKNKLYLAPLTTVGNLPFRRICVNYGADITCSEMVMASSILQGNDKELSLLRRHESEKIFGIQMAGCHPKTMGNALDFIRAECQFDFIDLNLGCPLESLCNKGMGCGLSRRYSKLLQVVETMNYVINPKPLTIKCRLGLDETGPRPDQIVHNICQPIYNINCLNRNHDILSAVTIHGRTRNQRYTKTADWELLLKCEKNIGRFHPNIQVIGNGDIYSWEEYEKRRSQTEGHMIGRGALIKPWLFQEIKEKRTIDMSSNDRFEMLKRFVSYALEHWGSDEKGVDRTRLFLLEWLSFLHRYIPYGILKEDRTPLTINDHVNHRIIGRNDLETLMASSHCGDWIKISEMLLGRVKSNFHFLPKHKANAYHYVEKDERASDKSY